MALTFLICNPSLSPFHSLWFWRWRQCILPKYQAKCITWHLRRLWSEYSFFKYILGRCS